MAENEKKSFILYYDQFSELEFLNMEERGEMISAIFRYSTENVIPEFDSRSMALIFKRFRDTLDRDRIKWENKCKVNKENGSKGGRPKTQNNPTKPNGFSENPTEPKHNPKNPIYDTCNMTYDTCNVISDNIKEEPIKNRYGLHNNVLLTDEELNALKHDFPAEWDNRIESVSLWYHNKGLDCTNGAEQIRNWKMRGAKTNGKYGKDVNQENELEIFEQYNI